jgi:hypothetical protein
VTQFDDEDAAAPIAGDPQHRVDPFRRQLPQAAAVPKREERRRLLGIARDRPDLCVPHPSERIEQRRAERLERLHERLSGGNTTH